MHKNRIDVKINKNKNIGRVVIIVEGENPETSILVRVFSGILNYRIIEKTINYDYIELKSDNNNYSCVYIIQSPHPNITSIERNRDEIENVHLEMIKKYKNKIENAATYYIFDRDRESNPDSSTRNLLEKYGNSREGSDYNEAGILLLSYPSIEAFKSILDSNKYQYFANAQEAKKSTKSFNVEEIKEEDIIKACKIIIGKVVRIVNRNIEDSDYDNFQDINLKVFDYEENLYNNFQKYECLTMIIFMLLDLNILEINDNII